MKREDEEIFLGGVLSEIEEEIGKLSGRIDNEKAQVKRFKEYINDRYGEMDVNELSENVENANEMVGLVQNEAKRLRDLGFIKEKPYFAVLRFKSDERKEADELRLGTGGFWSVKDGRMKLVDWRAPISNLYYDFDLGRAFYETGEEGRKEKHPGEILERAEVSIKDGRLTDYIETSGRVSDRMLLAALSGNASEKMKPVIATIQREQNEIIRDDKSEVLVVDGRAGSGKTVIAMHRLAWLLYNKREKLSSENVMLLSPNKIFSDYISGIMPELTEDPVPEKSWDELMDELLFADYDHESRNEQAEALKKEGSEERKSNFRLKTSYAFYDAFETYINEVFIGRINFKDFRYEKTVFPGEKLERLFLGNFKELPPYERFHNIAFFVLGEYLNISGRNFTEGRQDKIQDVIRDEMIRRYAEIDLMKIYAEFLSMVSSVYPGAEKIYNEEGRLCFEDMQVLFWLQIRLYGCRTYRSLGHLFVDEMQDYSVFQLAVIKMLFGGRKTFLGDRYQVMADTDDVVMVLEKLFPGCTLAKLGRTYRSTAEISRYCNDILSDYSGGVTAEQVERHGREVETVKFDNPEELTALLQNSVEEIKERGYESIAVLCENEEKAYAVYRDLVAAGTEAAYLSEQSAYYRGGLAVMSTFLAKGMEFDAVLVISSESEDEVRQKPEKLSTFYISCTRALHELYIFFQGR